MENIISEKLKTYNTNSIDEQKNALKEIMQEIILCGLSRTNFFKTASFFGGTALRIFHGIDRFSEDLDFSLIYIDEDFKLKEYLIQASKELNAYGFNASYNMKEKDESNVLTSNIVVSARETISYFFPHENVDKLNHNELIRIKIDIDTCLKEHVSYETKYSLFPSPYSVKIYDFSTLFSSKIDAVLNRKWKSRVVKGRDLYDYCFYLKNNIKVNLDYLKSRLIRASYINENDEFNIDILKNMLKDKFSGIDYEEAKKDVVPFTANKESLNIWSKEFFISITDKLESN